MPSILNLSRSYIGYSDRGVTSNPKLRNVDWHRVINGRSVDKVGSELYEILPGEEKTLFDGTISSSLDNTTEFSLLYSSLGGSRYRLTYTGGTDPVFRTTRALTLSGETVSIVRNSNGTISMTTSGNVNDFTDVVVGDTIYIPHTTTGDSASPFSALNVGYWLVLSKLSATSLQLARFAGTDFLATSETDIAVTADSQLQAFSQAGIQVGNKFKIASSSGFSQQAQQSFKVDKVTANFIEFISVAPIPDETGILPGAAGIVFYSDAKIWMCLESDQPVIPRMNGDTSDIHELSPWEVGDESLVGCLEKTGLVWSLKVYNKSSFIASVTLLSAG